MSSKEKKKRIKGKQKPDYQRLKEILKSDEFLGREKFEELRRQFARQGNSPEERDVFSSCVDVGERFDGDQKHPQRDQKSSSDPTEFLRGDFPLKAKDEEQFRIKGEEKNKQRSSWGGDTEYIQRIKKHTDISPLNIEKLGAVVLNDEHSWTGRKVNPGVKGPKFELQSKADKEDIEKEFSDFDKVNDKMKYLVKKDPLDGESESEEEGILKNVDIRRQAEKRVAEEMAPPEEAEQIPAEVIERCWRNEKMSSESVEASLPQSQRKQSGDIRASEVDINASEDDKRASEVVKRASEVDKRTSEVDINASEVDKRSSEVDKRTSQVGIAVVGKQKLIINETTMTASNAEQEMPTSKRSKVESIVNLEATTPEDKTKDWIIKSLANSIPWLNRPKSRSSADTRATRDVTSSDFDNGDSGIYEDLLKRNSVLTKQNTFDVARLPPYDADAGTKAYWECVLSSATNSGVLSECSFQLSQSTNSKLRTERFKALRSNVGNKWASFSSSFLKLRKGVKQNLPPPTKCGIEHIKVLQDTVQAMQQCVNSLEGLELRLKDVLKESVSMGLPLEVRERNPTSSRSDFQTVVGDLINPGGLTDTCHSSGKIITKEQLVAACERVSNERNSSDESREAGESRSLTLRARGKHKRHMAQLQWETDLDNILEELGL